jgi:beta-lactamase regulating signal transducer with metallopeptidase domain/membrane-associated protease RseP (regulator of RpoE activity)
MDFTWTSIASWLLRAGVGGSLLIIATLLAMRWVRQPARRQRLGELGMAAALVLAALCWAPAWLPLWTPSPPPATPVAVMFAAAEVPERFELVDQPLSPEVAPVPLAMVPAASEATPLSSSDWLLPAAVIAYGLGVCFYSVRWLAGVVALWRIVRAARPATPDLRAALEARWTGRRRPRLLISHQLPVPASCGIFRPTLILPAALAAPEHVAERDWVFDHELTHLARRDAWSAVLFALGQMVYFLLPWFWWLKRLVRLCQEYVADAAACRRRPADEYAEFLLSLTSAPAAPLAATGVTGTTSDLYRRVTMLLQNPVRVELSCPRLWTVGAAGVLLGLAVLAAGVGPAQAQPPNQKEILEQLERIQDMVNKLRSQMAQPARDDATKADKAEKGRRLVIELDDGVIRDVILDKAKLELDVKKKVDAALKKSLAHEGDTQRAQAELERARAELQKRMAQLEKQAADIAKDAKTQKQQIELSRDVAERQQAIEQYRRAIQLAQPGQAPRAPADKELKMVIELLEKHLADLKDSDSATKKQVQEAIERVKDAMKRVEGTKIWKQLPTPPALPKPGVIAGVPAVPAQPGVPAAPPAVSVPRTAVVTWTPDGRALAGADNVKAWAVLSAAQQRGRLGVRADAPGALLSEQLNLPKDQGLVITEVFDNSVAQKAGLKVNDILLKINQQPVSNEPDKLVKQVADIKSDTPFDIVVLRRGKQETIQNVRLADLQPSPRVRNTAVGALRDVAQGQGAQVTITVKRTKDDITLQRNEGSLAITVHAQKEDGKTKVSSIEVVEKGKESKYGKVEEVPESTRAKVQHLLQLLDSTDLKGPPRYRYQFKPPQGGEPGADIDLYYRIPKSTSPKTETFHFKLREDGSLRPLERLEGLADLNIELPGALFQAIPRAESKKSTNKQ